jgi:hypothetical protein
MKGTAKNNVIRQITESHMPFIVIPFEKYQMGPIKNAGQCQPPRSSLAKGSLLIYQGRLNIFENRLSRAFH